MATIALDSAYRRVDVDEFLAMDFGGAKAELDDGIIFMMAGGSETHARVSLNIAAFLRLALRGSACRSYGSDLAVRTDERSIRFPDVSVYCNDPGNPANANKQLIGDPTAVFEILSPSTERNDQLVKLPEYKRLAGLKAVVFVDPRNEMVRLVERTATDWNDHGWSVTDLHLPSLSLTIPHAEIFARD